MGDFVVAGAGSRQLRNNTLSRRAMALELILKALTERQTVHRDRLVVMSGMAEGFDELLATGALSLGIRLWAAIPNRSYGRFFWSAAQSVTGRDRVHEFVRLRDQAWKVTHVMEDVHHTSAQVKNDRSANLWRNDWMAAAGDDFLFWQPTSRGTTHMVKSVRLAGKFRPDMILYPPQLEIQ